MTFDLEQHRRDRLRTLERDVEFLRAERQRLEQLLGLALIVAAGRDCSPTALLDVLCEMAGTNPARSARTPGG
jgi:hypothetical protein